MRDIVFFRKGDMNTRGLGMPYNVSQTFMQDAIGTERDLFGMIFNLLSITGWKILLVLKYKSNLLKEEQILVT